MTFYPRLVIVGTSSGVGKTTVTLAILAALRKRGRLSSRSKPGQISWIPVTTLW